MRRPRRAAWRPALHARFAIRAQGAPKWIRILSKRIALGAERAGFANARAVRNEVDLIEKRQHERLAALALQRQDDARLGRGSRPAGAPAGEWLTKEEATQLTKEARRLSARWPSPRPSARPQPPAVRVPGPPASHCTRPASTRPCASRPCAMPCCAIPEPRLCCPRTATGTAQDILGPRRNFSDMEALQELMAMQGLERVKQAMWCAVR